MFVFIIITEATLRILNFLKILN